MKFSQALVTSLLLCASIEANSSFQMSCELQGEIRSDPVGSTNVEFDFIPSVARDIEVEVPGSGWTECQSLEGRVLRVVLGRKDVGDRKTLVKGAQIVLERYDMDVISSRTGEVVRSIKYVRIDT